MSFANTGLTTKESRNKAPFKKTGTVTATALPNNAEMIVGIDGVSAILNNVSSLQEKHTESKDQYFAKNLPFYTCLNAVENQWQKEMPDGQIFLVELQFDWEADTQKEKILKQLS